MSFSHAGISAQLMQRVIRGAAHVGGVSGVGGSDRIRDVLDPVDRALELDSHPPSAGSIEDELGAATFEDVVGALLTELERDHTLRPASWDATLRPGILAWFTGAPALA